MKHPEELKTKFLELRAQGVSYGRIAEAIGVSKPTLIQWGKAMAEEIADLQAAERELVREKLLGNFEQWLGRQGHHFNRLDAEFGRREFKYSPTESVFRMMMASRKVLDRYFFEDERPSRRGRAAAPPAAASQNGDHSPITESESRDVQCPIESSTIVPSPGGEGQDEGGLRCLSAASPESELDSTSAPSRLCVETCVSPLLPRGEGRDEGQTRSSGSQVYSENPAKTLPFPSQNSGVDNPALSSPPQTPAQSDDRAATTLPGAVPSPSGRGIKGEGQTSTSNSVVGLPKIETPNSKIPWSRIPSRNFEPKINNQSQLTTLDSPEAETDFGGESIPINPYESTREWLERQGLLKCSAAVTRVAK